MQVIKNVQTIRYNYNIWLMILLVVVIYLSMAVYQWRERVKKTFADKELFPFVFPIDSSNPYGFKIIAFFIALPTFKPSSVGALTSPNSRTLLT